MADWRPPEAEQEEWRPPEAGEQQGWQPPEAGEPAASNPPPRRKIGVTRSIADSIVEIPAQIAGLPGTLSNALEEAVTGEVQPGGILPSGREIIEGAARYGIHSGAGYDERTRGGQVAKVGSDIFTMVVPMLGLQRAGGQVTARLMNQEQIKRLMAGKGPGVFGATANFFRDAADTFARNPTRVSALEGSSAASAAAGGMIAEAAFPENDVARAAGELAGGIVNAPMFITKFAKSGVPIVSDLVTAVSRSGQERRAVRMFRDMMEGFGAYDEEALIARLRELDVADMPLSAGLKTGDEGVLRVENWLAENGAKFADNQKSGYVESGRILNQLLDAAMKSGDEQAIRAISMAKYQNELGFIDDTMNAARKAAEEAAERAVSPESPSTPGVAMDKLIQSGMRAMRKVEAAKWAEVPDDAPLDPMALKSSLKQIRDEELLPKEILPIEKEMDAMAQSSNMTSGQVKRLASKLGNAAQGMYDAGNFDGARVTRMLEREMRGLMADLPGYQDAVAFSRAFNERFSEGFVSRQLRTTATGPRIEPELTAEKAYGTGGTGADVNMRQQREAAAFSDANMEAGTRLAQMTEAQTDTIKIAAYRLLKDDGTVDPKRLADFRQKNKDLLARPEFAEVNTALKDAETAGRTLRETSLRMDGRRQEVEASAFARVAQKENPTDAVRGMVAGKSAKQDIGELADLASEEGPAAVGGLRTALFDTAIPSTKAEVVDFAQLRKNLTDPGKGGTSVMDHIRENGLMSPAEMERFEGLLARAVEVQGNRAKQNALRGAETPEKVGNVFDLVIRIAGAKLGSMGAVATSTGSSLVAAGAGSRALRNLLETSPWKSSIQILEELASDPKLMAAALEKTTPLKQQKVFDLLYAGITGTALEQLKDAAGELDEEAQSASAPQ